MKKKKTLKMKSTDNYILGPQLLNDLKDLMQLAYKNLEEGKIYPHVVRLPIFKKGNRLFVAKLNIDELVFLTEKDINPDITIIDGSELK